MAVQRYTFTLEYPLQPSKLPGIIMINATGFCEVKKLQVRNCSLLVRPTWPQFFCSNGLWRLVSIWKWVYACAFITYGCVAAVADYSGSGQRLTTGTAVCTLLTHVPYDARRIGGVKIINAVLMVSFCAALSVCGETDRGPVECSGPWSRYVWPQT